MKNKIVKSYSIEDFEKGLMLAGLISPSSVSEHNELACLQEYEKNLKKNQQQIYFKRVVLAAEIVEKLHKEPTLGNVKFQKLVYLCEHVAELELKERYAKEAAGPFDNKFMHSIGQEFKKQKWFAIEKCKVDNYIRYVFSPLEKHEGYKSYYENYFSDLNDRIQYIIELFRKQNTEFTELATTVFACFLELESHSITISSKSLIDTFYNWAASKRRFSESQITNSFNWLIEKGLIKHTPL